MAIQMMCPKCNKPTMHNSSGQCLNCLTHIEKEIFEHWKESKTLEERVDDLYWLIKNQNKDVLL